MKSSRVGWVVGMGVWAGLGAGWVGARTVPMEGERYKIDVSGDVVTLTDMSAVPVTGFRGTYVCGSAGPSSLVEDSVILGMGTVEAAKSSMSFQAPAAPCTGGVDLIVFADGQHVGSADAWKRVVVQRSAAYAEVSGLLALAEGMPPKTWRLDDFVARMGKMREALRADPQMGGDERRGRSMVLEAAMQGLPFEEKKAGVKTPAASRTHTVTTLIRWMNALDGALGKERVELPSGLMGAQ